MKRAIFPSQSLQHESWEYDPCLTDWLGIAEINHALPPVVGSAEICGEITAQTAALTGLKAGTPVVGGLFDVVSTALCAGIEDEFTLNAVMGTGGDQRNNPWFT